MATTLELADREAVMQALAEGRKVDPDVRRRIEERTAKLRQQFNRKFTEELSVRLIRSIREE